MDLLKKLYQTLRFSDQPDDIRQVLELAYTLDITISDFKDLPLSEIETFEQERNFLWKNIPNKPTPYEVLKRTTHKEEFFVDADFDEIAAYRSFYELTPKFEDTKGNIVYKKAFLDYLFSALKKAFPKGDLSKNSEEFVLEFDGSGQRLNHWQSPFGFHIYGLTKKEPKIGAEISVWYRLWESGSYNPSNIEEKELETWAENTRVESLGDFNRMVGFRNIRLSYDISKDERKIIATIKTLKNFFEK